MMFTTTHIAATAIIQALINLDGMSAVVMTYARMGEGQ